MSDVPSPAPPPEQHQGPGQRVGAWLWEVVSSWGPALLLVLVIRSVLVEPFQIPSGSMVPALAIGDFILVSKLTYGLRVPFTDIELLDLGEPERGDIVVFVYPPSADTERIDYIKRIVGLPGDVIELKDDVVYVNGVEQTRTFVSNTTYVDQYCRAEEMKSFTETVDGQAHPVLQSTSYALRMADYGPKTVPEGHYFMMGDNRDNSQDSRSWGFVPRDYIRGKAMFVWFSLDWCNRWGPAPSIRVERLGEGLK
jgi:signal peptidase I